MMENKVMLITYADSLGKNLNELAYVLDNYFSDSIGSVHILPFFPSTGDRGFAPVTYEQVSPEFGSWEDIEKLSQKYNLMFDFMINHISKKSIYFKDFQEKNSQSKYKDMFIKISEFFPNGKPNNREVELIYKRKDKAPFQEIKFNDGTVDQVWNTFGDQQIDLNVSSDITRYFIKQTVKSMAAHGCAIIRLDAFAYAIKKLNTNDFFVEPEIWNLLSDIQKEVNEYDIDLLPEIHEHYTIQKKISDKGYYIYDFALPIIMLHALYTGKTDTLANWIKNSPMKQFTTLDTHDGIGVVDAKDILSDEELDYTTNRLYEIGANVKRIYSSAEYKNLDIYQINTTYYSALGNDDASYLLARVVQCFAPGIPQIYYVGLLAGENDIELLEKTKEGRDINRHYYDLLEIKQNLKRPVVKKICNLLSFRNSEEAFNLSGTIEVVSEDGQLLIKRKYKDREVILKANFETKEFEIYAQGIAIKL